MAIDLNYLLLAVPLVAGVLVVVAAFSSRVERANLWAGLLRSGLAAIVLGALITGLVTVSTVGRPFLFGPPLTLDQAILLGLLAGAAVGAAWFVVAAGAVALGLLLGMGRTWARWGWFVGPVSLLAVGALSFILLPRLLVDRGPEERSGSAELVLNQVDSRRAHRLEVSCSTSEQGILRVNGDPGGEGEVAIDFSVGPPGEILDLAIAVGELRAPGAGSEPASSASVAPGWSEENGSLTFAGLVPMDRERKPVSSVTWSGSITWTCG